MASVVDRLHMSVEKCRVKEMEMTKQALRMPLGKIFLVRFLAILYCSKISFLLSVLSRFFAGLNVTPIGSFNVQFQLCSTHKLVLADENGSVLQANCTEGEPVVAVAQMLKELLVGRENLSSTSFQGTSERPKLFHFLVVLGAVNEDHARVRVHVVAG
jgi:hypothetical protein